MTTALTIPGIPAASIHPREEWQEDGFRMERDFTRLPTLLRPADVRQGAIHYSAAINVPDGDVGEFGYQIPPWLRAIQRDYLMNRSGGGYVRSSDGRSFTGYHIGYSFAFDALGGVWELRGFDFMPAATNRHNSYTLACLMISDRDDESTELAWASVRAVLREMKRRSGRGDFANRPLGHGEFYATTGIGTPTACPGTANLHQVHQGLADLDFDDGGDMGALAALPKALRAYDTRPGEVLDDEFVKANGSLPRTPMRVGDPPRRVTIGLATQAAVNVTAICKTGAGFVSLSTDGERGRSSVVNFDTTDRLEANSAITQLADGQVYVHVAGQPGALVDVVLDVQARG